MNIFSWHGVREGISEAALTFSGYGFWPGAGGAFSCLLACYCVPFFGVRTYTRSERLSCPYSVMVMIMVLMYA